MSAALEVQGLAFGYPDRPVGRDVTLRLDAGEVLVLLGPNGSGKTTLFRTLLGLLPAQAGRIAVLGRDLHALHRRERARLLAYVPQAYAGYFPFTVLEMVLMGRSARLAAFAVPGRSDRAVVQGVLERLGIADLAQRPYTRLSGGQRQLTLVARALAQEPRILIMDEPTASLDFGNQVRVLDTIAELAGEGMSVVLSTHHPDQAFQVADRVGLLHAGRMARIGPPAEVITGASLRAVYGVEVAVQAVTSSGVTSRVCLPLLRRAPPRL